MKHSVLFFLLLLSAWTAQGQVRLGFKGGMTTTNLETAQVNVPDGSGNPSLALDVDQARFGIQAGLLLQVTMGKKAFLQPEVLFNSTRVDFAVEDFSSGSAAELFSEKYQYVDLGLMLNYRLGPLRLAAGPVGHLYVNSTSDLLAFSDYEQRFETMTYGYQVGAGLDIWNIMLDFRYEGNFTRFGDHIYFDGQRYAFDEAPARLIFTLSLLLGK